MRLGPKPRRERLSAQIRVAMVCALVSLVSGCMGEGMSPSMSLFDAPAQTSARSVTMFVASTRRDDRRVGDAGGDGGVHHALVMVSPTSSVISPSPAPASSRHSGSLLNWDPIFQGGSAQIATSCSMSTDSTQASTRPACG